MKTIYLAAITKAKLIADIKNVFEDYDGETEFSIDGGGIHYIGDIPIETVDPDTGEVTTTMRGKEHANIYVQDDFDESVFETRLIDAPENPYNKLAE